MNETRLRHSGELLTEQEKINHESKRKKKKKVKIMSNK